MKPFIYKFKGKLIPDDPSFKSIQFEYIDDEPIGNLLHHPEFGEFYSQFRANGNEISINLSFDRKLDQLGGIYHLAKNISQSFYDGALLFSGVYCEVIIISLTPPGEDEKKFNPFDFSSNFPTSLFDFDFENFFELLRTNPIIRMALLDIKQACINIEFRCLFSYRSIETIMNSFPGHDGNPKGKWIALRESLNLSQEFFKRAVDLSVSNRHGKFTHYTADDGKVSLLTAFITFQRFVYFIFNKNRKLSLDQFPLLMEPPN